MPIRAENRDRYPKDWKAISKRIREDRAQGRCECTGECGLTHFMLEDGAQVDLPQSLSVWSGPFRCTATNGQPHPVTKSPVILTVAHKDHRPENCDEANIAAWCQRCHNRYDAPMRRAGIQERARAKKAADDLFQRGTDAEKETRAAQG